jgi:hypothetical protein
MKILNILKNLKKSNLIDLGYNSTEEKWIKNLGEKITKQYNNKISLNDKKLSLDTILFNISNISVDCDGHTTFTDIYTKTIISSIILNNYNIWKINCVHLNYDIIFNNFYLNGFQDLGNELLIYNFSKPYEHKILQEFNIKNNKKDNLELIKLLKIINYDKNKL